MKKTRRKDQSHFAKNLRALMAEKKITVRKAADIAGVGVSTIDNWRSGALPEDYAAVKLLAHRLGVSFSFLLTGEDDSAAERLPSIAEVFDDAGSLFDGYAKITIQRLVPRKKAE
jgi:transcriptional regulator with XRE-family HTH domain